MVSEETARGGIRATTEDDMSKDIPLQAILQLVEYLEVDEGKHHDAARFRGDDTSNHIFNAVLAVSNWLDTQPGIPSAADRERQRLAPLAEAFAAAGVHMADGDFREFWAGWDSAPKRH
jgi:hypothetical protein